MSEKVKEVKSFLGFSIGPVVNLVIGLISVPITTRLLIPTQFGIATFYTTTAQILLLIVSLSFTAAFTRFYLDEEDKSRLLRHTIFLPTIMWLFMGTILLVFRDPISILIFGQKEPLLILFLIIQVALRIFNGHANTIIKMDNKAVLFSVSAIIRRVLLFLFTVSILMFWQKSYKAIVLASILTELFQACFLFILTRKSWALWGSIDKEFLIELAKYALPMIPFTLIVWVYNATDKAVLRYFGDFGDIGLYSGAFKITTVITILNASLRNYWHPAVYRWHKEGNEEAKIKKLGKLLVFVIGVMALTIIFFKDLIILYLGPEYSESVKYLPFLITVPIIGIVNTTTNIGISFEKKTYLFIYIYGISAVFNLILNFLLIGWLGVLGCAIATCLASCLQFMITTIFCCKIKRNYTTKSHYILISLLLMTIFSTLLEGGIFYWVAGCSILIIFVMNIQLFKDMKSFILEIRDAKK